MKSPHNLKTVDQHCGLPKGSFKEFINEEERLLQALDIERQKRVRAILKEMRNILGRRKEPKP